MIPAIAPAAVRPQMSSSEVASPMSANGLALPQGLSPSSGPQDDFATVMSKMASDAADTVKKAETVSIKGINGQATTQSVVEAVMTAERTLQTAVSIRDKAVGAYMELSRMQI